jgi:hypothetical protein
MQYIHPLLFAEVHLHLLIACKLNGTNPPWGSKPRIELRPALQQAGAPINC